MFELRTELCKYGHMHGGILAQSILARVLARGRWSSSVIQMCIHTPIAHDPHFVARTNHFFSKLFMYQAPGSLSCNSLSSRYWLLLFNCVHICLYSQVYAGAIVMLTGVHTCQKV